MLKFPMFSVKDMLEYGFDYSNCKKISEEDFNKMRSSGCVPQKDDVLVAKDGSYLKEIFVCEKTKEEAILSSIAIFRPNQSIINSYYLCYLLKSPKIYNYISTNCVSGSALPRIVLKAFKEVEMEVPDIETQRRIVSILKVIDNKVQNNNKINRNLQVQLKTIFNYWFYEVAPFGGKEPEGTKYIKLEELCSAITKGTTPTTLGLLFTDDGINFIKGETILDNHGFDRTKLSYVSEDTHEKLKRSQIESGDIVFTIAGTLGRFALVDDSMIPANTNQAVAIVRANKVSPEYLYSFFIGNWHNDYYTKRIQKAVQANLSLGTIKSLPIMILPKDLYEQYLDIITPLILETKRIEKENLKLAELRDSLISKLMSGELDVSDLEV